MFVFLLLVILRLLDEIFCCLLFGFELLDGRSLVGDLPVVLRDLLIDFRFLFFDGAQDHAHLRVGIGMRILVAFDQIWERLLVGGEYLLQFLAHLFGRGDVLSQLLLQIGVTVLLGFRVRELLLQFI